MKTYQISANSNSNYKKKLFGIKNNDKIKKLIRSKQLYLLISLPLLYLLVFCYYPMYGAQIAFKNYIVTKGITGSPWVGFVHFERFFESYEFRRIIKNTIELSIYGIVAGFPFPIILALCINYAKNRYYMKTIQMITYMPYFISTVVMVGILMQFVSPVGMINNFVKLLGQPPIDFMSRPEMYKSIYVWSGIWQSAGYNSIIYIAALSSIDQSLHEAAIVDGASKLQRIFFIDIPGIMPTAIILLILSTGHILNTGFEKALLMQNPLNLRTSEVIDTYVYKIGLASDSLNYSYPTAIGLFKSVVGLALLCGVNKIARKFSNSSLW